MPFDTNNYKTGIEDMLKWEQLKTETDRAPESAQLRMIVGGEMWGDVGAYNGVGSDVLFNDVMIKNRAVLGALITQTRDNLGEIVTDLTAHYAGQENPVQEALPLIMEMPFYEGDDRYASITTAHKAVAQAKANIDSGNVGAMARDMFEDPVYAGLEEAIAYRMRADQNTGGSSLTQIYKNGVFPRRVADLGSEFVRKSDEGFKETTFKNYVKYVFENAEDTGAATRSIALAAYGIY